MIPNRNLYKQTWDSLSSSYQSAVINVTGDASEKELQEFGRIDAQKIIEVTDIKTTDTVLEIGCGVGRLGFSISDTCKEWIGCDISSNMLKYTKERLIDKKNIKLIELNENNLSPFPNNSVDVIYCSVVFMHLEEWDRYSYVEDSFRVLKNGGRLYIDNFTIESSMGWKVFRDHQQINPLKRKPEISKFSTTLEFDIYLRNSGFSSFYTKISNEWVVGLGQK